ncbi:MAG: hypothetical protein PHC68_15990 [Syntrophorhabdaceae bacterium]|jgi:hypothetical protein|nr:hypothetical protein [Syntrophorhabdaceae bacterium]
MNNCKGGSNIGVLLVIIVLLIVVIFQLHGIAKKVDYIDWDVRNILGKAK